MMHTKNMSVLARELGISRQAVSKLHANSERTGFPPQESEGWNVKNVVDWYKSFDPKKGPKAGIRK
jgi:hypothetical protein